MEEEAHAQAETQNKGEAGVQVHCWQVYPASGGQRPWAYDILDWFYSQFWLSLTSVQ